MTEETFPSFEENPNLGRKTVTTSSGKREYLINCKKIKGEYHAMNVDIFWIPQEEQWYRVKSGLIEMDYEKKTWVLVKIADLTLIKGVVGFKPDKSAIIGRYTPNPYNNCTIIYLGLPTYCISADLALENGYVEDFSTGIWHPASKASAKLQVPRNEVDHTKKGYNIEDNALEFMNKIELHKNYTFKYSKDIRRYAKMLGDITFGFEIECSKGYLPDHIQNRLGTLICRDGSLNTADGKIGPEFVTIPLQGAKGLQTLVDLSKELSKRTTIDYNCSLHIHLGNLPTTRMFLISLFRLGSKIQNELFTMFPFYKTAPEEVMGKTKNYCQKIPTLSIYALEETSSKEDFDEYINSNYKKLFSWLAEGYVPDENYNRKKKNHPVNHKWGRHKRYYWINFMNTIFSARDTVEFRLHTPTTNIQKMVNWLFICIAIAKYATAHSREILLSRNGVTMKEIIDHYKQYGSRGEFLSEYLMAYINERKQKFSKDFEKGDKLSKWEIEGDKSYIFQHGNTTHLF